MRRATIDIGTNTILLLITEVTPDGTLSVLRDEQVIARLGKGVDEHRVINAETFHRVLSYILRYKEIADSLGAKEITACGTSALRDAANQNEFLQFMREQAGISIAVLSGHAEAELTYRGAVSEFLSPGDQTPCAVLDIGGGSTELTKGIGYEVGEKLSLDMGSVRLTERVLKTSPPSREALAIAVSEVGSSTSTLPPLAPQTRLFGVAGTVTTLAAIDLGLTTYDPQKVTGHYLTSSVIGEVFQRLASLSIDEMLRSFPQIQAGRADIILAGVLILRETLNRLGESGITVSDRGLRYGIALAAHAGKSFKN